MRSCLLILTVAACAFGQAAEQGESEKREYHQHHVSGFLGGTHLDREDHVTWGAEYEFRFKPWGGWSAVYEHVNKDARDNVMVFPFVWHAHKRLHINVGPGFEREFEREGESGEGRMVKNFLFRTGATYTFKLYKGWSIGPDVAVDFVSGKHAFVYGISFGHGFRGKEF